MILLTSWGVKLEPAMAEGSDSAVLSWACQAKTYLRGVGSAELFKAHFNTQTSVPSRPPHLRTTSRTVSPQGLCGGGMTS